jgi:subtilisin family serine protease
MRSNGQVRQYVALKPIDELKRVYLDDDLMKAFLKEAIYGSDAPFVLPFEIAARPSFDWVAAAISSLDTQPRDQLDRLFVSLTFEDEDEARKAWESGHQKRHDALLAICSDLPIDGADHWSPSEAANPIFGTRRLAERLIRSDVLKEHGATGEEVNVAIIDRGLNARELTNMGAKFGPGWGTKQQQPNTAPPGGHGMMVARNIFKIAPDVTFFDCPLLPPHISNIQRFLVDAQQAYTTMLLDILTKRPGKWVFVNAWALYDRSSERVTGDYTNGPRHCFNLLIELTVDLGIDVVFCAGNCGEFCPSARCGIGDRGPGNSIFGANSHRDVITVGAVRTDGMWLGYSSQGPGQPQLALDKPDLCAPSQFCENEDSHTVNTGTSAACALTAGVVAAMRSKVDPKSVSPRQLKAILKGNARNSATVGSEREVRLLERRLGKGILNVETAFAAAMGVTA